LLLVARLAGSSALAAEPEGPQPLPANAPKLDRDVNIVIAGSSVSMNRYSCAELPKWTGGYDRMPPLAYGQNVFFRLFEMLNDHENMRWRRLTDKDWKREGAWRPDNKFLLKYNQEGGGYYGRAVMYASTNATDYAELAIPAGFEKVDLIYGTDPKGDKLKVSIDGAAPEKNAELDTYQETKIAPDADLGADIDTLDSHGEPRKLTRPDKGIENLELRARYALDPAKPHTLRVQRAGNEPGKRVLVWGAVYWRGHCVHLIQRAKGGLNAGDLPNYPAIQEIMAVKPDYLLMEAISIRDAPVGVRKTLEPAYAWCGKRVKAGQFKLLVYATPQANCKSFRSWFPVPEHKPPYGAVDYVKTCSDTNADACAAVVVDLCKQYGFPLVDVGPVVDEWMAKTPSARFVPHVLNDWYHPNQWGAALFGRTLFDGIQKTFPELPIRPINFPDPPPEKAKQP
jgi:hypothetical protein